MKKPPLFPFWETFLFHFLFFSLLETVGWPSLPALTLRMLRAWVVEIRGIFPSVRTVDAVPGTLERQGMPEVVPSLRNVPEDCP